MGSAGDSRTGWLPGLRACAIIPDPTYQGQQEWEADLDASPGETEQWRALLQLLATETSDPSDCYFGLWEGWPLPESARRWPTFGVPRSARIAARSFFLFRGRFRGCVWGEPAKAGVWGLPEFSLGGTPAFVWPSDHAWCVAADVDPHWAGEGRPSRRSNGSSVIDALTQSPLTPTATACLSIAAPFDAVAEIELRQSRPIGLPAASRCRGEEVPG